jgi:hypothetical protein
MSYQPIAFLITCVIEVLVVSLLARRSQINLARAVLTVLLVNALSHPFAWHFFGKLSLKSIFEGAAFIELMVTLFEGVIYRLVLPVKFSQAMVWSLVANLSSFGFGLLYVGATVILNFYLGVD